jgi:Family of unknown function (DUF5908)
MPIEIKELHIKVKVEDPGSGGSGSTSSASSGGASEPNEQLIAACVEKVLEILKEKNER